MADLGAIGVADVAGGRAYATPSGAVVYRALASSIVASFFALAGQLFYRAMTIEAVSPARYLRSIVPASLASFFVVPPGSRRYAATVIGTPAIQAVNVSQKMGVSI